MVNIFGSRKITGSPLLILQESPLFQKIMPYYRIHGQRENQMLRGCFLSQYVLNHFMLCLSERGVLYNISLIHQCKQVRPASRIIYYTITGSAQIQNLEQTLLIITPYPYFIICFLPLEIYSCSLQYSRPLRPNYRLLQQLLNLSIRNKTYPYFFDVFPGAHYNFY